MTRKTLKRQRKQRGGHAEDQEDVKKGLDALVTYFLWEINTKNVTGYNAERKKLVDAYHEYGRDRFAKNEFDRPTMIAIALLRNHMREDTGFDAKKEYGVIKINDLRYNTSSSPGHNRTDELRKAADAFQIKMSSENSNLYFESLNLTSLTYKALTPEKQKDFISKLFDNIKSFINEKKLIGKVKVFTTEELVDGIKVTKNETFIDMAKKHLFGEPVTKEEPSPLFDEPLLGEPKKYESTLLSEPEKYESTLLSEPENKKEPTLLEHLNTFENALMFIILYIFSVVKFSYKDIDRGFWLTQRIKLREQDTDKFRRYIIEEAEALLERTEENEQSKALYWKKVNEKYDKMPHKYIYALPTKALPTNAPPTKALPTNAPHTNAPSKIGGTRKRRMRKRATK